MPWAERGMLAAGLLLAGWAIADTPSYGKVETFQPGKKYNCVPTADHKGWDCSESGKAENTPTRGQAPEPAATPSTPPAAQAPAQTVAPTTSLPAAEAPPKASALPGYLMNNSAATNRPATVTPTPPPAPKAEPVPEPVAAAPAESKTEPKAPEQAPPPAPKAEPPAPVASAPAASEPETKAPAQSPAPAEAESSAAKVQPAAATGPALSQDDFLTLPSDQYVVELAHTDSSGEPAAPAVPSGKVYKLHLRQNGNASWLLLWGPFDSVETARAARNEIAAQGLTSGWPRPIGPLQAEARRASE